MRTNETGRSIPGFGGRLRKMNSPPKGEAFVWLTQELLCSHAWRALSPAAMRVVLRVCVEQMAHAGQSNGMLPVTFSDFERYGIRRRSIRPSIAEAQALGLIERTSAGRRTRGLDSGASATYRIAWLPTARGAAATRRWASFKSFAAAKQAAESAYASASAEQAYDRRRRRRKFISPSDGAVTEPSDGAVTEAANFSDGTVTDGQ